MLCCFLWACATPNPLKELRFQPISSGNYTLGAWYKITKPGAVLKVYIEGDGHAFDRKGQPTTNPTPEGLFLRKLAAQDTSPNVVYLARPCQYLMSRQCTQKDWTTGRFSPAIIEAMDGAVVQLMKKARTDQVILIGYSGGALVSSLIAVRHPEAVKKLITIAGVLDHEKWTSYHGDAPLTESMNITPFMAQFQKLNQVHYAGQKDSVVPWQMTEEIVGKDKLIVVKKASHNKGYEKIYGQVWSER